MSDLTLQPYYLTKSDLARDISKQTGRKLTSVRTHLSIQGIETVEVELVAKLPDGSMFNLGKKEIAKSPKEFRKWAWSTKGKKDGKKIQGV